MRSELSFDIDLQSFGVGAAIDAIEAKLAAAVQEQAMFVQSVWVAAVSGHQLPGMARPVTSERYAASIGGAESLRYPFNGDPFAGWVVATEGGIAQRVEEGYPSFDMKPGLLGGPNARTGKSGVRYNTVPFTHSTPGATGQKGASMPQEIYALAKGLHTGERLKLPGELAGWGMRSKLPAGVNAEWNRRQSWIGRFIHTPPMRQPYTWKSSPFEGMSKRGGARHTSYMTFRRVSSNSDPGSWIHPGMAANPVMQAVVDHCRPLVEGAFQRLARELSEA